MGPEYPQGTALAAGRLCLYLQRSPLGRLKQIKKRRDILVIYLNFTFFPFREVETCSSLR